MKKKISLLGILFMLVMKRPPMPEFAIFQKIQIVVVHSLSRKKIAMDYFIN